MAKLKINVDLSGTKQRMELEAAGSHEDLTAMMAAAIEEYTYRTLLPLPNEMIGTGAEVEAHLFAKAISRGTHRAVEEAMAGKTAGGGE